jgi:hypothetical protein
MDEPRFPEGVKELDREFDDAETCGVRSGLYRLSPAIPEHLLKECALVFPLACREGPEDVLVEQAAWLGS